MLRRSPILIAILIIAFSSMSVAQVAKKPVPQFDLTDFNQKFGTVQWLFEYDDVAGETSEILMTEDKAEIAKLGTEWFCFQDAKKIWHAVYGKLENGRYEAVFHYKRDPAGRVTRTLETIEPEFLSAYGTALLTAKLKLKEKIPANAPNFNQYIRRNADKTFDVWMLPAFEANGVAAYGGEGIFRLDATGTRITSDASYFQAGIRGFESEPPREIRLDYREVEKPTLGTIFFVWYYKSYFTNIYIDNSKSTSTVVKDAKGGYIWVHTEKDEKKAAKP